LINLILLILIWNFSPKLEEDVKKRKILPMDKKGQFCGIGKLKNFPNLFLQNFEFPLNTICVAECPNFDYYKLMGMNPDPDTPRERAFRKGKRLPMVIETYLQFNKKRYKKFYKKLDTECKIIFFQKK